jgi:hypothetical protein
MHPFGLVFESTSYRASTFVMIVSMALLCAARTFAAPADLFTSNKVSPIITNGGFEEGMRPWWGPGGEVVRGSAAEGAAALRMTGGFVAQDKRPIQGGRNYRVSVKVRCDDTAEGSVFVQLSFRGEGVDPGWRGPDRVKLEQTEEPAVFVTGGTHDWRAFSVVIAVPPSATELVLYLRKKTGTPGAAFYDAVEVSPTDDAAPDTAASLKRRELAARLLSPEVPAGAARTAINTAVAESRKPRPPSLTLAKDGRARYRIHVGTNADVMNLAAAGELAAYLNQISGGAFTPLSHDTHPQAGPLLVVGRDNGLTQLLCPDIAYDKLGPDGFVIRTVGPHLVIAGATPRGTMYGVNWFLDHRLGVKWLSPDYTFVPKAQTIEIAPTEELQVPRFAYREVLSFEGQDKAYRAHNLLNGESHGPSFSPTSPEIDSWDHSWLAKGGDANFFELLPPDRYMKEHPDWYAGGQLAMMNPNVRRAMADAVVTRLKQNPDYRSIWFDIHDMDWGWDMDPASKSFADKHGGQPSAPRLDMVIDVANRVRTILPGARFAFNAYHWSFTPPEGMTVPDYILVFPMTIQVDYSTPLNAGRNDRLGHDLAGWSAIAEHVLVWDHITNFSGFVQPTPNIYPIGRSLQWLATLPHVAGYFAEGSWNTRAAEFSSLRAWVIARLLWNPRDDVEGLVAEYCRYYFGAAGPSVKRYIDLMHASIAQSGDVLAEKTQVDVAMLSFDFVQTADRIFDEAESAVAHDPVLVAHVKQARMPIDYVILVRRQEYADKAGRRGTVWNPDTKARMTRFMRTAKAERLTQYRQGGDMVELAQLLTVERHASAPPELSRGLPRSDWFELQELSFNRYDSAVIVQDASASDGAAARMAGNSSTWAIHLKLDKLPKESKWELYAAIRVDAENGHDQDTGAIVGSYPPMALLERKSVGELNDGRYHFVKIPGGPFGYDTDHSKGVYVQAANANYLKYVYVDRIVAVKTRTQKLQ